MRTSPKNSASRHEGPLDRPAKARLKLIHDYIAHDAPLVAPQVIERLLARSRQIGRGALRRAPGPHRMTRRAQQGDIEYQREDLREVLERPYRLIYRIRPDRIDVITVMHYRQLLPSDLAKLK